MHHWHAKAELLSRLRNEIAACERSGPGTDRPIVSTGWPALDRALPLGGIRRGSIVELLDARSGCGAETLAAVMMRLAAWSPRAVAWSPDHATKPIVIVDRDRQFYPPALAAWGIPLERIVMVQPTSDADALWAADQALRNRSLGAVWLRRDRLAPHDFRRLQLAAEDGESLGLLFRPMRVRGQPSWADLQLIVEPRPLTGHRNLHVEMTRCRGGIKKGTFEMSVPGDAAVAALT